MRREYLVELTFETQSTGKGCEPLFQQVGQVLSQSEVLAAEPNVSEIDDTCSLLLLVKRDEREYLAEVESAYGSQESGFLIEISVKSRGENIDTSETDEVAHSVANAVRNVFPGCHQTH